MEKQVFWFKPCRLGCFRNISNVLCFERGNAQNCYFIPDRKSDHREAVHLQRFSSSPKEVSKQQLSKASVYMSLCLAMVMFYLFLSLSLGVGICLHSKYLSLSGLAFLWD